MRYYQLQVRKEGVYLYWFQNLKTFSTFRRANGLYGKENTGKTRLNLMDFTDLLSTKTNKSIFITQI